MSIWNRLGILERRIEAEELWPHPSRKDDKRLNIRSILIQRYELGIQKLSEKQISKIKDIGYDRYIVDQMNNLKKIGDKKYQKLCDINKIELTFEYIVFHNFRDKIKSENRAVIAGLLAKHHTT